MKEEIPSADCLSSKVCACLTKLCITVTDIYETFPINFSTVTGVSHLMLPRLKGDWLKGRWQQIVQGGFLSNLVSAAGLAAAHDSHACHFWLGHKNILLLTNPFHIKAVLIKHPACVSRAAGIGDNLPRVLGQSIFFDHGQCWRSKRVLLKEYLHTRQALRGHEACMERLTAQWTRQLIADTQARPVNLQHFFTQFTLDVMGQTLMHHEQMPVLAEALTTLMDQALAHVTSPSAILQDKLQRLLRVLGCRRMPSTFDRLKAELHSLLEEHVLIKKDIPAKMPACLLDALCVLHEASGSAKHKEDDFIADALFLVFAGHTTTATTFQFAVKLLAAHPEKALQLHQCLNDVLDDAPLTVERVNQIDYLEWVVLETLRLFPPVPVISRGVVKSFSIPFHDKSTRGEKIHLVKGTSVVISPYITHRSGRYFDHPNEFIPERFAPEVFEAIKHAYMPFGVGNRACIGQQFAKQELKLLLAAIYRHHYMLIEDNAMDVQSHDVTLKPAVAPMGQLIAFDETLTLQQAALKEEYS